MVLGRYLDILTFGRYFNVFEIEDVEASQSSLRSIWSIERIFVKVLRLQEKVKVNRLQEMRTKANDEHPGPQISLPHTIQATFLSIFFGTKLPPDIFHPTQFKTFFGQFFLRKTAPRYFYPHNSRYILGHFCFGAKLPPPSFSQHSKKMRHFLRLVELWEASRLDLSSVRPSIIC